MTTLVNNIERLIGVININEKFIFHVVKYEQFSFIKTYVLVNESSKNKILLRLIL